MTEHDVHPNRVDLGGFGVTYLVRGEDTDGRFALVEHDLAPRTLGSPIHSHAHEDEYSYVTAGRLGALIGDRELVAGPGELVAKPRGVPHAFWNAGDEELRFVELISPGGFERYFTELAVHLPPQRAEPDIPGIMQTAGRYGLTVDPASIPTLAAKHGLQV